MNLSMNLNLKVTPVFHRNWQADTRIVVNQGGTRSSKTYSICQLFIVRLLQEHNKVLTICRKTLPSLKSTAMRDFFEILEGLKIYDEARHNKTENTYRIGSNLVEFVSLDQPQKKRGAKRDYLWMNEANEFNLEDWRQLSFRTTGQIFLDFNPSDEFHWIYDEVLTRDDVTFIVSTYLDNPFLPDSIVKEIERLKELDENYWKVYGEGQRGASSATIYTHWQLCDALPEGGETIYGLDFGFNNPTALVQVVMKDNIIYAKELIYQSFMTNSDVIERLKELVPNKRAQLYGDAAEPNRIEEIYRAGFNIKAADKDVKKGIDSIKARGFYICKDSTNLLKEAKSYKWKEDKEQRVLDEPVKFNDHILDALRYAVHTHTSRPHTGRYSVR